MTPRKEQVEEQLVEPPPKPRGFFTSEFFLAVLILIVSGIMVIVSKNLSAQEWIDLAKWVSGGYAVSRGLAKISL